MQGTNRSGEGGRRACYVTPDGSELRLGGREKNEGEDHEWDGGCLLYTSDAADE